MSELFKENGFLTEAGQKALSQFKGTLEDLLSSKAVKDISESELRALGCNLASIVADAVSNKLQAKKF